MLAFVAGFEGPFDSVLGGACASVLTGGAEMGFCGLGRGGSAVAEAEVGAEGGAAGVGPLGARCICGAALLGPRPMSWSDECTVLLRFGSLSNDSGGEGIDWLLAAIGFELELAGAIGSF